MSYYGGLLGGINQTNKTLTSILTLSDGFTTISGGQITGTQSIETDNITINNTINVPEIITSNIQTQSGTLVIGDISDNITIYGSEIKLVGNVIGYDSANVYIVDNRIELNSGGGNLLLPDSGISVLGDGNIAVSSLLTDNNGDWVFSSPNNKLTVGSLNVANLAFDNLESGNITATNKFITSQRAILDATVSRSMAISHLNAGDIKNNNLFTENIITKGIRFSGNTGGFKISYGAELIPTIAAGALGQVGTTFDTPFKFPPIVVSTAAGLGLGGYSQCYTVIPLGSVLPTTCLLQVRNTAAVAVSNITVNYIAIGI